MRIPGSWNDRSLLQDEPFKSWFTFRSIDEDRKRQEIGKRWMGRSVVEADGERKNDDWGKNMVVELRGNYGVSSF